MYCIAKLHMNEIVNPISRFNYMSRRHMTLLSSCRASTMESSTAELLENTILKLEVNPRKVFGYVSIFDTRINL